MRSTTGLPLPMPCVSAWDPRSTASGSIDPLGALRAHTAMATTILPGVTTITTRARYLSWLCAGLYLLDQLPDAPRGGRAGRERRKRLLAWERLVALATGLYATGEGLDGEEDAWRRLRGISYVRRAVADGKRSPSFPLLRNQAGVGGVGTYWVTMVNGGLVESEPARLTKRGEDLARVFLSHRNTPDEKKLRSVLAGAHRRFSLEELVTWGSSAHLGGATKRELALLADALLEPGPHRVIAAAMKEVGEVGSSDEGFAAMGAALERGRHREATKVKAVLDVARPFERLHGELLDRFDQIRAADIHGRPIKLVHLADLAGRPGKLTAAQEELRGRIDRDGTLLPRRVSSGLRDFLNAVEPIVTANDPAERTRSLLRHHERVQSGKLDSSRQAKQPWIELRGSTVVVAPRYALTEAPHPRESGAFTHRYRIEELQGMLLETGRPGAAS